MIKTYEFTYNHYEGEAVFRVDTDKFKPEDAQVLLDFFTWKYDEDADPIDELMKKYAMQAIMTATSNSWNEQGVKKWFEEEEGMIAVDGSQGVELISVEGYEFNEDRLHVTIR